VKYLDEIEIERVETMKYLSIIINDRHRFQNHCNYMFVTVRLFGITEWNGMEKSILLLYNLAMCYRPSYVLSTQSAQLLLRSDNFDSSQLLVSRKDTRSVSSYV